MKGEESLRRIGSRRAKKAVARQQRVGRRADELKIKIKTKKQKGNRRETGSGRMSRDAGKRIGARTVLFGTFEGSKVIAPMNRRHISPMYRGSAWQGRMYSRAVLDNELRAAAEIRTAPFLDLCMLLEGEHNSRSIHVTSACSGIIQGKYAGRRFWARGGVYLTLTLHVVYACIHTLHNRGSYYFMCACICFALAHSSMHADRRRHTLRTRHLLREHQSIALHCMSCHCAPSG